MIFSKKYFFSEYCLKRIIRSGLILCFLFILGVNTNCPNPISSIFSPPDDEPDLLETLLELDLFGAVDILPDSGGGGCSPVSGTGSIDVNISGSGGAGNVTVFGPSYERVLTATTSLSLPAGEYYVSPAPIRAASTAAVDGYKSATVSGTPMLCLDGGESLTIDVVYSSTVLPGRLWVLEDGKMFGYNSGRLATLGAVEPDATITLDTNSGANRGIAFDDHGRVWISDSSATGNYLMAYRVIDLQNSGTPTPVARITFSGISDPRKIAFDSTGNLWVANAGSNTVIKFNATDLNVSGEKTPSFSITGIVTPLSLSFDGADGSGNLWVTSDIINYVANVFKFSATQLATGSGGALTPAVSIRACEAIGCSSVWRSPASIAFDSVGGSMYTHFGSTNTTIRLTSAEYAASGDKIPAVDHDLFGGASHMKLAFDENGDLWVATGGSGLAKILASSLGSSTTARGAIEGYITSSQLTYPEDMAFFPTISGLPIASSD